jgi:Na+/H+-dicarboxylate symporter
MTVIPLVTSMLVAGVASVGATGALRRAAAHAAVIALALITVAAVASAVIAQPILARVAIDRTAAEALRPQTTATLSGRVTPATEVRAVPSPVAQWLIPEGGENDGHAGAGRGATKTFVLTLRRAS